MKYVCNSCEQECEVVLISDVSKSEFWGQVFYDQIDVPKSECCGDDVYEPESSNYFINTRRSV